MRQFYKSVLSILLVVAVCFTIYNVQEAKPEAIPGSAAKSPSIKPVFNKKLEDPMPQSLISGIQQSLAKREYNISFDAKKQSLQSPNRQQNLRAYYKPGHLTIQNRVDSAGHNFQLRLVNEGVYADGRKLFDAQANAICDHIDNKLQIKHQDFTEEYINNEQGIRQNFIINQAPVNTKVLNVHLNAEGLNVKDLGNNELAFYAKNENAISTRLIYKDLQCWDANGQTLTASLSSKDEQILLSVNVAGAAYPVTIDPIVVNGNPGNANAILQNNQTYANLGWSVASAGDVNGDGFSDVLVSSVHADNENPSPATSNGEVYIYYGAGIGIDPFSVKAPDILKETEDQYFGYGWSAASAGDVNGDGFSDVIVGDPSYNHNGSYNGAAFIYYGTLSGITPVAAVMLTCDAANANFGFTVASAGDINNDGYSDVIVGSPDNGQAFVFHGSASGVDNVPEIVLEDIQQDQSFGWAVASAGDVNADGFSDVIIGAHEYDRGQTDEGVAFIYHGAAGGLTSQYAAILEINQSGANFGRCVGSAGDVNGDGFSDVVIGAPYYDISVLNTNEGAAFIYHGSASGVSSVFAQKINGEKAGAWMGHSVASAGDVNGDGYSDIVVGEHEFTGSVNEGAALVFQGSASGILSTSIANVRSGQADSHLGWSVRSAGDVNGDGFSDIIVGAPFFDSPEKNEGAAFIYHGSASGLNYISNATLSANQNGSQMGYAVSSAGDVNGDGFNDVIVGAPYFDNGETNEGAAFLYYGSASGISLNGFETLEGNQAEANMGFSVSGAGDINGDGYADVLVGAPLFDDAQTNTGRIFIFHGSPGGLNPQPASTLSFNQLGCRFGHAAADGGDVNGDGFSDIIVGAPGYSNVQNGEGAAFVYYGSGSGILNNALILESNKTSSFMGGSVSGAGDVNGDGYSDVIAGDHFYNDGQVLEGAAFIYYGSQSGIDMQTGDILQINVSQAALGTSVSCAGDVNGDGFSDVIVGADHYIANQKMQGGAFIFHGSSSGIDPVAKTTLLGNQEAAHMGYAVAGAGDVNGDGYADVVVGAPQYNGGQAEEGALFVYHGSPAGINPVVAIKIEKNQGKAQLGYAVAGAGDVNGDGYSDIISGAPFDAANVNIGQAFTFHGNLGAGLKNNLRLYNSDLNTLINHDNIPESTFGVGLFEKSFLGRNKGKLVWETRKEGEAFSKPVLVSSITGSTEFTEQQSVYSSTGQGLFEYKNILTKIGNATKVRVRIKYDPVLAITGQVYGPWHYSSTLMLNGGAVLPVELVRFNAAKSENVVELSWVTASEVNSKLFEIQRSSNAENWEVIGHVEASLSSQDEIHYAFTDTDPQNGDNHYRLKMIDQDDTFALSRMRVVNFNADFTHLAVEVFPNPVSEKLFIRSKNKEDIASIELLTVHGKAVYKSLKPVQEIDVRSVATGVYLLRIAYGNGTESTQKLAITR
ncbi:FG-GAP-like repeat-containing protein [Dyadobacter psychrophilus]|uniref:Por secretion system C-terminal sorting domain-containing protein n=1 Tax=Dyadobacter psychrophilus TaxID=651661 RepID=A0A1T5CD72_9BACT|nr:FG-GAP-like repeat-containing protein [Dyadobacter psychrophilus]SKB57296.1 Por secretion system C-terminal sorting domain-containing protein [Dyadobacter psychrophilus]